MSPSLLLSLPLCLSLSLLFLSDKLDEILAAAQQTINTNEAPGTRGQGPKRDRGRSFYGSEVCILRHATVYLLCACVCVCVLLLYILNSKFHQTKAHWARWSSLFRNTSALLNQATPGCPAAHSTTVGVCTCECAVVGVQPCFLPVQGDAGLLPTNASPL